MTNFDPTQSSSRVVLAELYNMSNSCEVLLNPNSLRQRLRGRIAKLDPPGWSHQILQGSGSESVTIPLDFYLSSQLLIRHGSPNYGQDLTKAVNWFSYFLYPKGIGVEKPPMVVIWPNILIIAYVVESMDVEYTRFNRYLKPVEAKVSLTGYELRSSFRNSDEANELGWLNKSEVRTLASTGAPMSLGGSRGNSVR